MMYLLEIASKENKYKGNKICPNMDPWGTPLLTGAAEKEKFPEFTEQDLSNE